MCGETFFSHKKWTNYTLPVSLDVRYVFLSKQATEVERYDPEVTDTDNVPVNTEDFGWNLFRLP